MNAENLISALSVLRYRVDNLLTEVQKAEPDVEKVQADSLIIQDKCSEYAVRVIAETYTDQGEKNTAAALYLQSVKSALNQHL